MKLIEQFENGSWYYSQDHGQICQVIESQTLWDEKTCRVWIPGSDSLVRMPASRLAPLADSGTDTANGIAYVTAAGRVADALTHDLILEPIESSIVPLSHQIQALSRAILNGRVRYLLANPVGLGKTLSCSSLCGNSGCTFYSYS